LTELPNKRISTHSLRVSFAKLMHDHGCNIRSLNELMLHRSLNTTAAYTPITVDDLRRAVLPCHPRA
jgi:site-specific recombinase XerD